MGQVLRTVALAGSFARGRHRRHRGAGTRDEAVVVGPAETASAEESAGVLIAGAGEMSVEELTAAILAEVLQRVALPASGGLESDVPTTSPDLTQRRLTRSTAAAAAGDDRGGAMGGDVTLGGGAMPAPAPEARCGPLRRHPRRSRGTDFRRHWQHRSRLLRSHLRCGRRDSSPSPVATGEGARGWRRSAATTSLTPNRFGESGLRACSARCRAPLPARRSGRRRH